jgi:hypothetical protein
MSKYSENILFLINVFFKKKQHHELRLAVKITCFPS